jgi:predicted transcriptional regulator
MHATIADMGELDDAASAYRKAVTRLDNARKAVPVARRAVTDARALLAAKMVEAARAGMSQAEIQRRSGYTRERVRQILRAGGIEPAGDD